MLTLFPRAFGRASIAVALFHVTLMLAARGTAAEPQPTAPPATAAQATSADDDNAGATAASARLAPTFELPNAAGETVSLASYTGGKNVALDFYRGAGDPSAAGDCPVAEGLRHHHRRGY